jgi:hypothetical protein
MKKKKVAKKAFLGKTVIVRSTAGVFMGALEKYCNAEATLTDVRRLWYWSGAASLSQLAMEGTSKPKDCKFPCAVDRIIIPAVMEMLDVSKKAKESIDAVPEWRA